MATCLLTTYFSLTRQVPEHTTGRHIKGKAANLAVFETLLRDVPRIVTLGADAGALTANTLRRYQPARHILWHIHEHHVAAGRRMDIVPERDDALEAETRPTASGTPAT